MLSNYRLVIGGHDTCPNWFVCSLLARLAWIAYRNLKTGINQSSYFLDLDKMSKYSIDNMDPFPLLHKQTKANSLDSVRSLIKEGNCDLRAKNRTGFHSIKHF